MFHILFIGRKIVLLIYSIEFFLFIESSVLSIRSGFHVKSMFDLFEIYQVVKSYVVNWQFDK